jgi:hypothetical protein
MISIYVFLHEQPTGRHSHELLPHLCIDQHKHGSQPAGGRPVQALEVPLHFLLLLARSRWSVLIADRVFFMLYTFV